MKLSLNADLQLRRLHLALSEEEVATRSGLSVPGYRDLESFPDEFLSAISLATARKVCETLGLDLLELIGISGHQAQKVGSRHCLLASRRAALGLSTCDLADRLGFTSDAVEEMELKEEFLESWPLEIIVLLAAELSIDLACLV